MIVSSSFFFRYSVRKGLTPTQSDSRPISFFRKANLNFWIFGKRESGKLLNLLEPNLARDVRKGIAGKV